MVHGLPNVVLVEGAKLSFSSNAGIPTLPRHFAGIGTRDLSAAGRQAIAKVYHETFASQVSLPSRA